MKIRSDLLATIEGSTKEAIAAMNNVGPQSAFVLQKGDISAHGNHGSRAIPGLVEPDDEGSAPLDSFKSYKGGL